MATTSTTVHVTAKYTNDDDDDDDDENNNNNNDDDDDDDDDGGGDDDDDDDDDDRIERCAATISTTYAQVAKAQSCANSVQHIGHSACATCRMPRGTMGQFSY